MSGADRHAGRRPGDIRGCTCRRHFQDGQVYRDDPASRGDPNPGGQAVMDDPGDRVWMGDPNLDGDRGDRAGSSRGRDVTADSLGPDLRRRRRKALEPG